jgi:hypothetical protein
MCRQKVNGARMKMFKRFYLAFLLGLVMLVISCTGYQSKGLTGGYSDTQMAQDVFRVNFAGNAYTSGERAQDFTLLRAAQLTITNGYKYFAVLDEQSYSKVSTFTTPGQAYTTGTAFASGSVGTYSGTTTYTPSTTHVMHKPRSALLIKCFNEKPDNIQVFDASFIEKSIKQKYNLN